MFYPMIPSKLFILLRILPLIVVLLKLLIDKYNKKQLVIYVISATLILMAAYISTTFAILEIFIFIIGAKNVDFKKIVTIYFLIGCTLLLIAVISSQLGVIQNLVYYQNNTVRNSFGIVYPTDFAAHVFYLIICFCYLKNKRITICNYLVFLLIAIFLFKYSAAKLDSFSIILTIIGMIIYSNKKSVGWILKLGLQYSIPICASFFIGLTAMYNKYNPTLVLLNNFFSSRLSLGKQGLDNYMLTLFGQEIQMSGYGGLSGFYRTFKVYFFIDCSYLYILLAYGIVVFLYVIVGYVIFCRSRIIKGDILLPLLIALIAINSMVAHHLLDLAYNPFILVFLASHKFTDISKVRQVNKKRHRSIKLIF